MFTVMLLCDVQTVLERVQPIKSGVKLTQHHTNSDAWWWWKPPAISLMQQDNDAKHTSKSTSK